MDICGPSYADQVAELAQAPVLARMPLKPDLMTLADTGRVEEIDDPVCDELAQALDARMRTLAKPRETISLI